MKQPAPPRELKWNELQYMLENYSTMKAKDIATHLGMKTSQVYNYIHRNKHKMPHLASVKRYHRWKTKEVQIIINNPHLTMGQLAKLIGLTPKQIDGYRSMLKRNGVLKAA